jgi:hypothetical protein
MKVRSTHCVELLLEAHDLARILGHPEAAVKEAEVHLEAGEVTGLRVHLEYEIATKGHPKRKRVESSAREEPFLGG